MTKKKKSAKRSSKGNVSKLAVESAEEAVVEESSELLELAEVEGLNLEFNEEEVDAEAVAELEYGQDAVELAASEDTAGDDIELDDPDSHFLSIADEDIDENTGETLDHAAEGGEPEIAIAVEGSDELAGTELADFESADIENLEVLTAEQVRSITESVLFSTDKPLSIAVIKQAFKGTNVKSKDIREALTELAQEYTQLSRGFSLSEAGGGFQLRTKAENMKFLRQSVKVRPFRLSGPALEVMSIVAYKQPATKAQIDEIRGVESGHLLRALMERHLITFGERSDLPGKPMFYESTRKFLEIFGLRNLNELPSLSEIDQLIPEGIGEVEDKETLSDLTGQLSQTVGLSYSEGEDELLKITDELTQITTSSEFFEQEKVRMREKRDLERAQNIREAQVIGEIVEEKDARWLERYDIAQAEQKNADEEVEFVTEALTEVAAESTTDAVSEQSPEPAEPEADLT